MAESKQRRTYTDRDMVRVVVDGQVLPDPVPSSWVGTDLLPPDAEKATRAQVKKSETPETSSGSGDSETSDEAASGPVTSSSGS